mmetsp:Transcript_33816/g.81998  ORF Transcript_33816/g.81998 Transcript_33816/m.81998 type:complete len:162 (+) Transcript_33816:20-505(+)
MSIQRNNASRKTGQRSREVVLPCSTTLRIIYEPYQKTSGQYIQERKTRYHIETSLHNSKFVNSVFAENNHSGMVPLRRFECALNDWILSGRRCSGPTKSFSANDKDDSFVSDTKKSSEIPLKRLLSSSQYVMLEGRRGSVPVKSEDTNTKSSTFGRFAKMS